MSISTKQALLGEYYEFRAQWLEFTLYIRDHARPEAVAKLLSDAIRIYGQKAKEASLLLHQMHENDLD